MPLVPVRVELEDRRRPLRPVALTKALVILRLLADMDASGSEVIGDELSDALVRVDLGIQPSTPPSHRRGAEVQQHGPPLRPCLVEYTVDVMPPRDFHVFLLSKFGRSSQSIP